MADEQEIQKLFYTYRKLESQLNSMNEQLVYLQNTKRGNLMTRDTIEGLKESLPDHDIMLPIGSSAYIKAKVINPDNFLVTIGADVFVEKNGKDALEFINNLDDEYDKIYHMLVNKSQEISGQMNQIRPQLERLSGYQGQIGQQN
ncbi:MAG: prefoldin subunit alpha [Promethearchaeota archaeon]